MYTLQITTFVQRVLITALLATQTACDDSDPKQLPNQALLFENQDPCVIAQTPHQGKDLTDMEIQKYQKLLTRQVYAIKNLEKLGWAYVNKAQSSFDPGFYKLAEQTVSCMNLHQPGGQPALLLQGHVLHNLHRFKQAEVIARQLTETRGYWYDYALLGDVLMEQGELTSAIAAYQEMMNQNPGPQAYNRTAHIRWLKGDLEGAIELLELSFISHAGQNTRSAAWTLTRLADYEFQSGNIDISLNYLSAVLLKQPDYAPALLLQGRIKMAQGLFAHAEEILTHALQLNPLPEYRWALIEAITSNGKPLQTHPELEKGLLQNGAIEDRRTFALFLATRGINSDQAIGLAGQELELRHDVLTLDTYAWALRSHHQLQEAGKYSDLALSEGTHSARLFYHAGVIASERGQLQKAKQMLERAKQLESNLWPSERRHLHRFL